MPGLPISRKGVYCAVQSRGACSVGMVAVVCISMRQLRRFCPSSSAVKRVIPIKRRRPAPRRPPLLPPAAVPPPAPCQQRQPPPSPAAALSCGAAPERRPGKAQRAQRRRCRCGSERRQPQPLPAASPPAWHAPKWKAAACPAPAGARREKGKQSGVNKVQVATTGHSSNCKAKSCTPLQGNR